MLFNGTVIKMKKRVLIQMDVPYIIYNSLFEGAVKYSENCWIMFHPISFNLCDNGPLISACGRLKLIGVIYLGLENLFICCEYLCKHQSP